MKIAAEFLFDLERQKYCETCGSKMVERYRPTKSNSIKRGGWTCKPCSRQRSADYRANSENADKLFDTRLWTHYRIRLTDYQRLLEDQDFSCAACGKHVDECTGSRAWGRLVVDHDHSCCETRPTCGDCVRGLICSGCNVALGHTGDSVEQLERLIAYIKRYH